MGSLINDLTASLDAKDETAVVQNLNNILTQGTDIELDSSSTFAPQIIALNNEQVTKLFVEVVAEWCKIESNRKHFTNNETISFILDQFDKKDEELVLESVRALGNICFENEEARKLIDKRGLVVLVAMLKDDTKDVDLIMKACGLLVNLFYMNEELQKEALRLDITGIIEKLMDKYVSTLNQMLVIMLLTVLNACIDHIDEMNIAFKESLCHNIIKVFKMSTTPELAVTCLEILHGQAEKDNIKLLLAKGGVCELVYTLIGQYKDQVNDEATESVLKMACDLIVVVLTGDDCMVHLYGNGKGLAYKNMLSWLNSTDGELLSTGVLALGNFARKETHCIQMVQEGVSKRLIELLAKYNKSQSDIKVQHALLSTLKNLAIPQPNKAKILSEGLIDVMYPMIEIEEYLVVFKLLGTFRIVIDGQEKAALDLLSRRDFLEKLVHWWGTSDHLGVRGEVPRLLAWLIKHCHSFKPFRGVLEVKDCVKCLVEMTSSNHAVMQNESYYALSMLCIGCIIFPKEDCHKQKSKTCCGDATTKGDGCSSSTKVGDLNALFDQLIEADIGKNLAFAINKYGEKMDEKTIENLFLLLEQLVTSDSIVANLKTNELVEALQKTKFKNEKLDAILELLK